MESLDQLAAKVFDILGNAGVPAEIIGGYALSHYGYVRNTMDIDVVVGGDYAKVLQLLKDNGFGPTERVFKLSDPSRSGKFVDVLPAGKHMSGCPTPNPQPTKVSHSPEFISIQGLIAMKIGVLLTCRADHFTEIKNEADVIALIRENKLPRDLFDSYPHELTRLQYGVMWDDLEKDRQSGKTSSLDDTYDPFSDFFNS